MPARAKRFYLCNLIPLWEIDEEDMDVDWPVYHAYFDDLIDLQADIRKRKVRYKAADGSVDPDLKIRFEVYESDFLLSGGFNDRMAVISSHAGYGDDPIVRPIKITEDIFEVPAEQREQFIFIEWMDGHDDSSDTLLVRAWWKVKEEEGGDVSGAPEYYYDVKVEGRLEDGEELDLEERSDHELEGLRWNVTDKVRPGRVTALVDGEYVFLKQLQLMDAAQHSIHLLGWSLDLQTPLAVSPLYRADYALVPGLDTAAYRDLLLRNKPYPMDVSIFNGMVLFTSSNGNLNLGHHSRPTEVVPVITKMEEESPLLWGGGVELIGIDERGARALVVDTMGASLYLFVAIKRKHLISLPSGDMLISLGKRGDWHTTALVKPAHPNQDRMALTELVQRARAAGASDAELQAAIGEMVVSGVVALAGQQLQGYRDTPGDIPEKVVEASKLRIYVPLSLLNHPFGVALAPDPASADPIPGRVFVTDTGNHCLRVFHWKTMETMTFAGDPLPGDLDGTGPAARFRAPTGVSWDPKGKRLFVADSGNRKLRAVNGSTAQVSTFAVIKIDGAAGALGEVCGLAINPDEGEQGVLFVSERNKHRILAIDLKTREARTLAGSRSGARGYQDGPSDEALFDTPLGLSFHDGLLAVADSENHVVRVVNVVLGFVSTIGVREELTLTDMPVTLSELFYRKARQGVEIRVLLDSIQGPAAVLNASILNRLYDNIQAFVQYHVQHWGSLESHKEPPTSLASFHDKMLVVDGRSGFTGGVDMGAQKSNSIVHESFMANNMFWHDISALVEGKAAFGLEEHFAWRWNLLREELRVYVEEERPEQTPSITVAACFSIPRLHYEDERLVLDASCSRPTVFQEIVEYRWKIIQKFLYKELVVQDRRLVEVERKREGVLGEVTLDYATARLERKLDPGEYTVQLTVKSSGGGTDTTERSLEVLPSLPDAFQPVDRTDASIQDHPSEVVRTWDPSPVFVNIGEREVTEILESYRRAILAARHYVYMEHQYIFYPEVGEFLEQAMKDNKQLHVIWTIPFFTEETQDPYQERTLMEARDQLISSAPQLIGITPAVNYLLSIGRSKLAQSQFKSQLAWHGFYRQHEMVEKLRKVDAQRFGLFSVQRLHPVGEPVKMIYPHSKILLVDDRFMSIGSANANGRGFIKDSENNVSALSAAQARDFRDRLWGEHLSYLGLGLVDDSGRLFPTAGHHLRTGGRVRLRHPDLGDVEREATFVDPDSGGVMVEGGLDPSLRLVLWQDLGMAQRGPEAPLSFWREAAFSLDTYRKLQTQTARSNADGDLVLPGHLVKKGYAIFLGGKVVKLDEEGFAQHLDGLAFPPVGGLVRVADVNGDVIKLAWPGEQDVSHHDPVTERPSWVRGLAEGATQDIPPFRVKVKKQHEIYAEIEFRLLPNQEKVAVNATAAWLVDQPPAERFRRAWEIDPPQGIEYAGPGSTLRWVLYPFTDLDPDEHARLERLGSDVAVV